MKKPKEGFFTIIVIMRDMDTKTELSHTWYRDNLDAAMIAANEVLEWGFANRPSWMQIEYEIYDQTGALIIGHSS